MWGTAIDFQSINADYVITGILTDRQGNFYLDMNTGDLRMKNGTFVGNITGGTISIGNNFSVDSNGNMNAKNAKFQGSISGGTINIGNNFSVDSNGNMNAKNAKFQGSISGGTINIGNNFSVDSSGNLIAKNANLTGTFHNKGTSYNLDIDDSNYRVFDSYGKQLMGLGLYIINGSNYALLDGKNGQYIGLGYNGINFLWYNPNNDTIFMNKDLNMFGNQITGQSDIKVKKDISTLGFEEEEIFKSMNPVKFKYKNNGTDGYSIGFIANEIEDKIKSLNIDIDYYNFIKTNEDILSLAYSEFIAINTYMIKKCMKRIDYLEEKIK